MPKIKLDPAKEATVFDCYIDRKVTIWIRDKYRIAAETEERAIERLKELSANPTYEEPEFIECETLFDTEEGVLQDGTNANEEKYVQNLFIGGREIEL
jgi:hypothetical protein